MRVLCTVFGMDILWSIGLLWISLLCSPSSARVSVLPIPKDFSDHGTQYRFQYFIRDERGDYKTQEEAGEGGSARGSYAVEEPDGDLRIIQYTADLSGDFKAHIEVDHAGRSSSKLQEINIPAAEMRKLIERKRMEATEKPEVEASKSYDLGPPRMMSEIVMEQAAAIKEIISKELEAEERREEEEKMRAKNEQVEGQEEVNFGEDIISHKDCKTNHNTAVTEVLTTQTEEQTASERSAQYSEHFQIPSGSLIETHSHMGRTDEERVIRSSEYKSSETVVKNYENKDNYHVEDKTTPASQILRKNPETPELAAEMNKSIPDAEQTPVIRVALSPKAVDFSPVFNSDHSEDSEKSNLQSLSSNQNSARDIFPVTPSPFLAGPLLGGPVRNLSFRNRIMFFKPADRKLNHALNPNLSQEITGEPQNVPKSNIMKYMNLNGNVNIQEPEGRMPNPHPQNDDQIVLYSPFQQIGTEGYHKTRYVTVPYSVLRPFLMSTESEK